jgi:cyclic pyranopterin phosphate synthase
LIGEEKADGLVRGREFIRSLLFCSTKQERPALVPKAMLNDVYNRPLKDLRISVTDRCNFRCTYCMPLDEYDWIDKGEILTFEEIVRLAKVFVALGVTKIRLTGGEPLIRKDLHKLIQKLSRINGLEDLSLTTNGSLLAEQVVDLTKAGLKRVNVSLDTLNPEKFKKMTKRGDLEKVLAGLFAAKAHGLRPIKINVVVERGINEDDIIPLTEFARQNDFHVRFIEYLDVGNANNWMSTKVISKEEILRRIADHRSLESFGSNYGNAPAIDYRFIDGGAAVGVIASMTEPFCSTCSRARLTADGKLVTCLFARRGHDLKTPLRRGADDAEIAALVSSVWQTRTDRYSDERLAAINSGSGYVAGEYQKLEMISLGG